MDRTLQSGRRLAPNPFVRMVLPSAAHRAPDGSAIVSGFIGAVAFAAVLLFIASSIDAPMAKLAAGLDPSIARLLLAFSQIGSANWMLVASAAVGAVALAFATRARRPRARAGFAVLAMRAGFLFLTVALSVLLVQAIKYGLGRAQPHMMSQWGVFHFSMFSPDALTASFPSGHATTAFAAAAVMALFAPRWQGAVFALALAVAVARIAVGAHFPSDVLGGMVLGMALAFALARYCARRKVVFHLVDGKLVRRGERLVRRTLKDRFAARA